MRGLSGVGRGTDAACGCADARGDPRISEAEGAEVKLLIYIYSYILLQRGWKKRRMNDARDVVVVVVNGGEATGREGGGTKYAKEGPFPSKTRTHQHVCATPITIHSFASAMN